MICRSLLTALVAVAIPTMPALAVGATSLPIPAAAPAPTPPVPADRVYVNHVIGPLSARVTISDLYLSGLLLIKVEIIVWGKVWDTARTIRHLDALDAFIFESGTQEFQVAPLTDDSWRDAFNGSPVTVLMNPPDRM
jgi:hypothetical protein